MTIEPFDFGNDLQDNVDSILASHTNNLRAWLRYTAALGRNANREILTSDKVLGDSDNPIQYLDPTLSGYSVVLPSVGSSNHIFYFINTSDTYNLVVKSGTTEIVSIDPGSGAIVVSDGTEWRDISGGDGGGDYASKTQSKSISIFFPVPVVGDGAYYFDIPEEMNGWELTDVHAHAITAPSGGLVQVQIRNVTDSVDALSTVLSIDATEHDSNTAATPPVINPLYDDVATDDIWAIDFDAVNSTEKVTVRLTFTGDLG